MYAIRSYYGSGGMVLGQAIDCYFENQPLTRITSYNVCYTKLLRNYLTGNEFNMQLRSIVEGFMQMQSELDKERRSLMASWKRRQKLIDGVLANTTEMYGALQGIAGSAALGHIDALELPRITSYNVCYTKLLRDVHH